MQKVDVVHGLSLNRPSLLLPGRSPGPRVDPLSIDLETAGVVARRPARLMLGSRRERVGGASRRLPFADLRFTLGLVEQRLRFFVAHDLGGIRFWARGARDLRWCAPACARPPTGIRGATGIRGRRLLPAAGI